MISFRNIYFSPQVGPECDYHPNIFLMSMVLFAGSFAISFSLKNFRNTGYFPGSVRSLLSDFAVLVAIISMTLVDYMSGVATPKLEVPGSFAPTWEGRDWFVTHAMMFTDHVLSNPWYTR